MSGRNAEVMQDDKENYDSPENYTFEIGENLLRRESANIYMYIGEKQFGESGFRLVSFPSPLVVARNIIVRKKMLRVLLPRFLSRREARLVRKSDARIARSSVIKSLIAFTHPSLRLILLFLSYSGTVRAMQ